MKIIKHDNNIILWMKKAIQHNKEKEFRILCKTKVCWMKVGAVLFFGVVLGLFLSGINLDYTTILHLIDIVLITCILAIVLDVRNLVILEGE